MKFKTSSLLIAGALFGAAVLPAQANNEAMMDLLKVLRDQGTITEANYDLLTNAAKADKESTDATKAKVAKVEKEANKVKITTKGKLKFEGEHWSFQPIGRVMWDAIDTDEDGSGADEFHGTELRRARLGFQGKIYDWGYKLEGDFAKGNTSIKDAYISYGTKLNGMNAGVKLGQSHIPYGLNTKVSSKYMTFMDRPFFADTDLSPARESGVVASLAAKDYKWLLGTSLTNGELEGGETENTGSTLAVRGSFLPYKQDKTHLVQIGAGFLTKGGDNDKFSYKQRLVSHKDHKKWLDTSVADHDGSHAYTLDALGIYGPFHAMAEYNDYTIEAKNAKDIDTKGYAVELGYFITGESIKWKKGYLSGITPKSPSGAWEVAARFESMELDEHLAKDKAEKVTVGLNYYPTQNTRLMVNYDHITNLKVNGDNVNYEPSSLKFRAQAYW